MKHLISILIVLFALSEATYSIVTVTPATGGGALCNTGYTTLGNIVIDENANNDIAANQTEDFSEVQFLVFDAVGNAVYSSFPQQMQEGSASFTFDVTNNLKPGVYVVRGGAGNNFLNKKIMINK